MLRALLIAASLLLPATALALEQPVDGEWWCGSDGEDLGALAVGGDTYRFTDLAGMDHEGTLEPSLRRVQFLVTSGLLRDLHRVISIKYDGAEQLTLIQTYNDGSTGLIDCHRT